MAPAIVLVPGSYSPASCYQPLALALRALGHDTFIIPLQSATRRPAPAPGLHEDAAYVAAEIRKLADQGREVLLVGHSYSGMVVSQCVQGLTVGERGAQGKAGGVVRIVYIAALVGRKGEAVKDFFPAPMYAQAVERGDPYQTLDTAAMAPIGFNDLHEEDPAAALAAGALMTEQSTSSSEQPLTWPGYAYAPRTYISTKRDMIVVPELQQRFIDVLKGVGEGGKEREVELIEMDAGHCPNATRVTELAEVLSGVAGRI